MNHETVAALLRGLCIDITGKPQIVMYEAAEGLDIPASALTIEKDVLENDESAAGIILKAYETWAASSAGNKALGESSVIVPSCAALRASGKTEALYWIDGDFDSAEKRRAEKNTAQGEVTIAAPGVTLKNEERAALMKNRIALVTGGAQGIGEEIVRNLAAAGAFVFIADLNLEGAAKLSEDINAGEKRTAARAIKVNVSDEASVAAMFTTVAETCGGLDLCVSNAGVLKAASVLEQELADFKFVTDINYTGFFVVSKYAGRLLRTQHRTAPKWKTDIAQINSKSGLEGSNKNGAYAGGKFGGLGLVASFAMELVEYNIKVNAICPGNFLDGPLWSHPEKGLFVQYLKTGKVPGAKTVADVRAFYEAKVPMKRGCTGKDLVRALLYIVEQEYETGQAVPVTGGQIMLH
jgi:sorbitol-6-phosphate 2-dehydrogenase